MSPIASARRANDQTTYLTVRMREPITIFLLPCICRFASGLALFTAFTWQKLINVGEQGYRVPLGTRDPDRVISRRFDCRPHIRAAIRQKAAHGCDSALPTLISAGRSLTA
jgi:hypothetical protein